MRNICKILMIIMLSVFLMAQEITVPIKVQFPLFMKILSFDRNLEKKINKQLIIAIIYQSKFRTSLNTKNEISEIISEGGVNTFKNNQIIFKFYSINDINDFKDVTEKNRFNILFITPLRAIDIEDITDICTRKKILTFSTSPDYIELGAAVSIDIKGEKPQIIINLNASKSQGADFSSQLLKLSKVIN